MKTKEEHGKQDRRKIINFRPVLFFAAFFALGIGAAYSKLFREKPYALYVLIVIAAGFLLCALSGKIKNSPFIVLGFLTAFAIGAIDFYAQIGNYRNGDPIEGEFTVVGTVDEIETYQTRARLTLEDVWIGGKSVEGKLVLSVEVEKVKELKLSDEIVFTADVRSQTDLSDGFDAENVSANVRYNAYDVKNVAVSGKNFQLFRAIRERLRQTLYDGMDETPAAVTYALLTGNSSGIDQGLLENVRKGGIAHIFAVSGLHIGVLYAFLRLLIVKTKLKKRSKTTRFLLVSLIILLYGGICGFSPSVLRASLICLTTYFAELIGTKSDPLERIGFAAILILLIDPSSLLSVGFQLSFCAALGILILSRTLRDGMLAPFQKLAVYLYKRKDQEGKISLCDGEIAEQNLLYRVASPVISVFAVSIAAQLGTAPVQLHAFGYLSAWGLLLNPVVIPLIGGIYSAVFTLSFLAALLPFASSVLLFVPNATWSAILLPFQTFSFSRLLFEGVTFSVLSVLLYYIALFVLSEKIDLSRFLKAALVLALFFAFEGTMYATNGNLLALFQGKIMQGETLAFFANI